MAQLQEEKNSGWIKIDRSIMSEYFFNRGKFLQLWIALLCEAAHKKQQVFFDGKKTFLKPGQFITGRKKLALQLEVSESTIERMLDELHQNNYIEQVKTYTSRLISILTDEERIKREHLADNKRTTNEQLTNNERTTSEQLADTKEEVIELNKTNSVYAHTHPLSVYCSQLPQVGKLKKPLTDLEAEKLVAKFSKEIIYEVLKAMENKPGLTKKYLSAYDTILSWCKTQRPVESTETVKEDHTARNAWYDDN